MGAGTGLGVSVGVGSDSVLSGIKQALAPQLQQERTLGWGSMFGEISVVADLPYFNTAIAKG
jgi:hypothetical protein